MRCFKLGDKIGTAEWGSGVIVAMSREWCIMANKNGEEFAVAWEDGIWLQETLSPPEVPVSSICKKEME